MWQIMLIYSNAFNIFLSFFRSRSTSFAHPRFSGHFVSLAKPYASMHSIHFTCHIIHVYVFRFKINRTKGKCRHSIYVSFERERRAIASIQFIIFSLWIINVYTEYLFGLLGIAFYSSQIPFNWLPFCTLYKLSLYYCQLEKFSKFDCHTDRP